MVALDFCEIPVCLPAVSGDICDYGNMTFLVLDPDTGCLALVNSLTSNICNPGTLPPPFIDEFTATASQTLFTLTKAANGAVRMEIDGIGTSISAYASATPDTINYTGPALSGGERINFYYNGIL